MAETTKTRRQNLRARIESNERETHMQRTLRVARDGLDHLHQDGEIRTPITAKKRDAIQYRACISLGWTRDQIIDETGWPRQRLIGTEEYVREEDARIWGNSDPIRTFAEYREMQLLCAKELADVAETYRSAGNVSAAVSAIKARSELFDRVIKVGQDLGVVRRAAREVSIQSKLDIHTMSVSELRVQLAEEVRGLNRLLQPPKHGGASGVAGAVLRRVLTQSASGKTIEVAPEVEKTPTPRIKKLSG